MNEFGVSDEHMQKVREQHAFEVEAEKDALKGWLREAPDFPARITKIHAMMELVFEHYLDLMGEQDGGVMMQRHFLRVAQKRKGQ
jgi:hypothetical protein